MHQGVVTAAYLVQLRGDRTELALRSHVVEVDGERPQELLGHKVDRPDVGVEEPSDIALEEICVGDVDTAQMQLHVERRGQPFVESRVGFDDVHPAADLGELEGLTTVSQLSLASWIDRSASLTAFCLQSGTRAAHLSTPHSRQLKASIRRGGYRGA